MSHHIAALGTLIYATKDGSVTFPGDVKTKIVSRQVKTSDGRAIKYVEHTLSVSGWVFSSDLATASGTVDGAFDSIKQTLSQPGGALTIVGKGFGDIYINRDSSQNRDVEWGPFPEIIEWEPLGNITCRFVWEVKFTLPWKKGAALSGPNILEYTWTTSYKYDSEGFCDRTITGEIDIAGSRWHQNAIVEPGWNIETYFLSIIKVECPIGFHRRGHELNVDKAKTKVTFSFWDDQNRGLTNPPGISNMEIIHKMSASADRMTISKWIWTFSATAIPDARYPTGYGYQACLDAFQSRFQFMLARLVTSLGAIIPFPVGIEIVEKVRERSTSLTSAWVIMAASTKNGAFMPADILARSGLWQPFPWTEEVNKATADAVLGPNRTGAYTRMAGQPDQNVIIDISSVTPYIPDPGKAQGNFKRQRPPRQEGLIIQPFGAYIEFVVWIECQTEGNRWVNYPLTPDQKSTAVTKGEVQEVSQPYNRYRLCGYIKRIGIPAAGVPSLTKINGQTVEVPSGEVIQVETYPDIDVLGSVVWETDFVIPYIPVAMDASNPIKKTDQGNGDFSRNIPQQQKIPVNNNAIITVPSELGISNLEGDNKAPIR